MVLHFIWTITQNAKSTNTIYLNNVEIAQDSGNSYMGGNFLSGKYALSVSLFVRFHGDLESKWAIGELEKKVPSWPVH